MDAPLRERFGKYHVLGKIAQGGMAEVYKVKTIGIAGFEKIQALKRILPHSAREARFIRSFVDEARIAVELTHRNIVQVFDFGKAEGELFLAMELIEGTDLRTAVAQTVACDRLCPIPVAAYIVGEIAAGLDYAHKKTDGLGGALGIVHCDVSPSNVMLSTDGYVKILDFGIARASFASALERRRLRGKPRYMAPEQTVGEPATYASDVFALGIIAWELLTGLPLYRGHDLKSILQAVRKTEPPRVDRMNSRVPAELCDAVATALSRAPEARGTAADLAHACARTALLAGARHLAAWLAEITATPVSRTWHDEGTSVSEVILLTQQKHAPAPEPETTAVEAPPAPALDVATSYDVVDIELPAPEPEPEPIADEPIDDDLAAIEPAAPVERRRAVIVACAVDGAEPAPLVHVLGELAYQRGGVVVEAGEAALLVAFGLEVAGEDDVAVAMAWALDATAIARDAGAQLRAGARTGVSAPTDATGPKLPADAVDEARALAREAQPERPLFAGVTGRVTSSLFALREVPTARRIGRRGKAIEIAGPRTFDERARARLERRGNLIGRARELAELDAGYARAVAEARRVTIAVVGAAGTGKSRLVAELLAGRAAPATIAAATPASRLAPFSLVIDLYQAALGLPPARGRPARTQVVQSLLHVLARAGLTAERARAVATDLDRAMELRDGAAIGAPEVADLRPRVSVGYAAFRAATLERGAARITVIEDVHHCDTPSLEVLRHLLAASTGPELLVLTGRPDGAMAWPPADATLALGDLVGAELRALVVDRLGGAAAPASVAAVIARAGGNPLFVEELAQAVRESGGDPAGVPATARDVVAARVDRVGVTAKAALRFAAVLGPGRLGLLDELVGDLQPELDELVAAGLLARGDGEAIELSRGLIREVIYDAMPLRVQREHHQRVGRLLASRFFAGRDEPPAEIAEHLERGGDLAAAAAFWLRAGRSALAASDTDAAIAHLSRCLTLDRELGVEPPTPASRARRREALGGREEARRRQGDLASDPGDLDELARLCDGHPARLADVALRRAQRLLRAGDYPAASSAAGAAEEHAIAARDARSRGEALRMRGEVLERLGRFDEALAAVDASRALFARIGTGADEMAAMVARGRILVVRARYDAARDACRPVLAGVAATDPWLEREVTNQVAVIELCLGNFDDAMAHATRALELCRRHGDRVREGGAHGVAGLVLLEVGRYDDAAARFAEALALLARTSSRWSHAECLVHAGACELRRGNARGMGMLDDALADARRLGARYLEVTALIARAGAHLRAGAVAAALDDAAAGTAIARDATLVGQEIHGLAQHALGLARIGGVAEGVPLARRAVALLEAQRFIAGSEEGVLAACAEVLRAAGEDDRPVRARARAGYARKLEAMADGAWRAAFAAIAEHAGLR